MVSLKRRSTDLEKIAGIPLRKKKGILSLIVVSAIMTSLGKQLAAMRG